MKIDRNAAGFLALALAVVLGFALGLYGLTPADERMGMLAHVGAPVGSLLGLAVSILATRYAGKAHAETAAQTPVIDAIQHQTNGQLTARMIAVVNDALDARGMTAPAESAADVVTVDDALPAS